MLGRWVKDRRREVEKVFRIRKSECGGGKKEGEKLRRWDKDRS
jgi:hypothetical protein